MLVEMRLSCMSFVASETTSLSALQLSVVWLTLCWLVALIRQHCQNTEMFASTRNAPVVITIDDDDDHTSAFKLSTSSAVAMTPQRRTVRNASFDSAQYTPTRTQNASAALEMLSRSAPPAARTRSVPRLPTTPSKRAANGDILPTTDASPSYSKRKLAKVSARNSLFMDRIEEAAAGARPPAEKALPPAEKALPPVETALTQDFGGGDVREASLARLCRSLLHAAMAVDASGVPEAQPTRHQKTLRPPAIASNRSTFEHVDTSDVVIVEDGVDDLLCEELIEPPGESSTGSVSSQDELSSGSDARQVGRRRARSIAAAQERAILQEVSVWLRNITNGAAPTGGAVAASSR